MKLLLLLSLPVLLATQARAQDPCGTWSVPPIPVPPSSTHTVVEDVEVLAPDLAWAVGRKVVPVGPDQETQTVAWRWDGAAWTIVPTPSPSPYPGGGWSELLAVEAVSPDEVWAAGSQRVQAPDGYVGTHLLVERWNGSTWSVVPAPMTVGGSGNFIDDIEIVAPDDIWFVGDWLTFPPTSATRKEALTMHWDGSSFTIVPAPFFNNDGIGGHGLTAIDAVSSDDIWAVGGGHDGDYVSWSYIVHWNGSQWEYRPGATAGFFSRLYDVHAVATDDVWVVGDYQDEIGYHALVQHWDGSSWTRLPDPPHGGGSIHAFAFDQVYVSGAGIARWDGTSWSSVETFPGVGGPSILALEPIGPCSLWGVGRKFEGGILPLSVRLDAAGGAVGSPYCALSPNSSGPGASISATGSASVSAANLALHAAGAPALKSGLFFYGDQQVSVPFGNGLRCVGGALHRLPVLQTTASGTATQGFGYAGSAVTPGSTWNFQFWFRDPDAGGANFNASNALQIVFAL